MGDPRPKLSVFSQLLFVARVAAGWPVAHVADQLGGRPDIALGGRSSSDVVNNVLGDQLVPSMD